MSTQKNVAIVVQYKIPGWDGEPSWEGNFSIDQVEGADRYTYYDTERMDRLDVDEAAAIEIAKRHASDIQEYFAQVRVVKLIHTISSEVEEL